MFILKTIFSLIFCLFPVWGAAQDALPGKAKTDAVAIPLANDSVSQHAVFDAENMRPIILMRSLYPSWN